ncbi:MAG: NAD(P)/FAD-dependent oxidoreductase [Anaerolineae bacterium]|nr:NAD(P)/FAD-dependent oxidoreductase [Anaerolineae bacterium]
MKGEFSTSKVFEPITIGTVEIKNRIVAGPMVMNHATEDGHVTPRMIEYYAAKARGGFGLVHVEASYIRPDGNMFSRMLGVYSDRQLPGLNEIVEAIHAYGAKCTIQLVHGGRVSHPRITGQQPVAPSDSTPPLAAKPRGLTVEEIEELVLCYARAAVRAKEAGFDGAMIHGAHGFLIAQFVSPHCNKRKDKYGKDRYLFVKQIVEACRAAVGPDYPLFVRISADEFLGDEGLTIEETKRAYAPLLQELGIDCIDVSAGIQERVYYNIQPLYTPRANILYLAEEVKKVVDVPVIGVGRINDPRLVKQVIETGRVDMISLARQSLADPELPRKMAEDRPDDVRRCIACDLGCSYRHIVQWMADCAINYEVTREAAYRSAMQRPIEPQKVAVVGGGVAGMEAARVAALRGHKVTLYERSERLGGLIPLVGDMPRLYMHELNNVVEYLSTQLAKLDVDIKLKTEATADLLSIANPDVVILAAGSTERLPNVPGVDGPKVVTLLQYLRGGAKIGHKVVVWGGHEGAEAAVSLARQEKQVTILEESDSVADATFLKYVGRQLLLRMYLEEEGVEILTGATVEEIGQGSVTYSREGQLEEMVFDTLLVALGRVPDDRLAEQLKDIVPVLHRVGDCLEPHSVRHSIHSAARVALEI